MVRKRKSGIFGEKKIQNNVVFFTIGVVSLMGYLCCGFFFSADRGMSFTIVLFFSLCGGKGEVRWSSVFYCFVLDNPFPPLQLQQRTLLSNKKGGVEKKSQNKKRRRKNPHTHTTKT